VSGWPVVTLSDVATLSSGGTPSKSQPDFWNGDIPWVSPKDMKSNHIEDAEDKITKEAIAQSAARVVGPNSILAVVRSGILSHSFPVATVGREVAFNQDIKAITPKNGYLLTAFLFWMLKSREENILRIGVKKGATVHSLSNGFLDALRFPLPPLDEQRRIVGLLDRAAEIRRRAEAARAKARAIIPALFLDTFGDPATNPNGWPVEVLANVTDIGSGLTKGRMMDGQLTTSCPYLRVANVQDGYLDLTEIKTIEATDKDREKCRLLPGDLLMTEGGDPDKLGRCAIWRGEIAGCLHQNHIFRVRVEAKLLPDYTAAFIQSHAGKSYFLHVAKRTTGIASINKTQLGALPVVMPPLDFQNFYAEQVQRIEMLARNLDAATAKAQSMAAALSAEVFEAGPRRGNGHAGPEARQ
jgi:type I restriction enzyme S subunit